MQLFLNEGSMGSFPRPSVDMERGILLALQMKSINSLLITVLASFGGKTTLYLYSAFLRKAECYSK